MRTKLIGGAGGFALLAVLAGLTFTGDLKPGQAALAAAGIGAVATLIGAVITGVKDQRVAQTNTAPAMFGAQTEVITDERARNDVLNTLLDEARSARRLAEDDRDRALRDRDVAHARVVQLEADLTGRGHPLP